MITTPKQSGKPGEVQMKLVDYRTTPEAQTSC
jgi:hypothetical protein